jgi:hypothetical protein
MPAIFHGTTGILGGRRSLARWSLAAPVAPDKRSKADRKIGSAVMTANRPKRDEFSLTMRKISGDYVKKRRN